MIQLGDKVRDSITGYSGIVVAITEWLYGCRRIGVQAQELKDGKPVEECWFDEQRLTETPKATTGGPRNDPSRASDPKR